MRRAAHAAPATPLIDRARIVHLARRLWQPALIALFLALLARSAQGQIIISADPTTGTSSSVTPVAGGKFRVNLATTVVSQPTTFIVRGAATDKIERIEIAANVPQIVFVGVRGYNPGTTLQSVDAIDKGASTSTVIVNDLRTSADVGSISVNTISAMNVGGDITGDITLLLRQSGGESSLIAGTVNGRIRGNIFVDHGAIYGLTAVAGVGTALNPVQVRTKLNLVRLTAGEIYADITTLANAGAGVTAKIETTTGPFVGSLTTTNLQSTGVGEPGVISIAQNLDADLFFFNSVQNANAGLPVINVGGRFLAGRLIYIGHTLATGAEIRINQGAGLESPVIINAADSAGLWQGDVRVGAAVLGPKPRYSATHTALGGGSVGQVPFEIHSSDCKPSAGQIVSGALLPSISNPVLVRFYGAVNWDTGQGVPFTVERRPITNPAAWSDVTSCFFAGREQNPDPNPNVVALFPTQPLPGGFVYRVTPIIVGPARLFCDLALATNPSVAPPISDYTFTVLGGCPGDANSDGLVNFNDVTTVLANWGTAIGAGCGASGDANSDGLVDFNDITSILANWGTGCALASGDAE